MDLTVAAWRHGGLTELGDADLSEQGVMALSGHKTPQVARLYVKKTVSPIAMPRPLAKWNSPQSSGKRPGSKLIFGKWDGGWGNRVERFHARNI
jgi:hypothetical protein